MQRRGFSCHVPVWRCWTALLAVSIHKWPFSLRAGGSPSRRPQSLCQTAGFFVSRRWRDTSPRPARAGFSLTLRNRGPARRVGSPSEGRTISKSGFRIFPTPQQRIMPSGLRPKPGPPSPDLYLFHPKYSAFPPSSSSSR